MSGNAAVSRHKARQRARRSERDFGDAVEQAAKDVEHRRGDNSPFAYAAQKRGQAERRRAGEENGKILIGHHTQVYALRCGDRNAARKLRKSVHFLANICYNIFMARKFSKWLRLDNSAKIFPMMANKNEQNLFCLAFRLYEDVEPAVLNEALVATVKRFPSINVKLKKGVFWHYFEEHTGKPRVYEASPVALRRISPHNCNGFYFRISYYRNNIYGEFFHALTDGKGAAEFMKSLLFTYFRMLGKDVDGEQMVMTINSPPNPKEYEDSFQTYYQKKKLSELPIDSLKGQTAFAIPGAEFDGPGMGEINIYVKSADFLSFCHAHNATVTEMIGALFILSLYDAKIKPLNLPPQNIQLFVPINLRRIFPSETVRNFSLFSRIGVMSSDDMKLDELIAHIHEKLTVDTQKDVLGAKISTTVYAEKFLPLRLTPLFLKRLIFNISNLFFGKHKKTATFSSVGVLKLPESFRPLVRDCYYSIAANKKSPITVTAVTSFDMMCINFTRSITDTDTEKRFVKYLHDAGLEVTVSSNYWEVENAL